MFEFIGEVFPMLVLFMLLRGILTTLFGGKRRQQEQDDDQYDYEQNDQYEEYEAETDADEAEAKRKADYVRSFEEKLKGKDSEKQETEAVERGGIHRENCQLPHEKQPVYREPEPVDPNVRRWQEYSAKYNQSAGAGQAAMSVSSAQAGSLARATAQEESLDTPKPRCNPLFKGTSLQRAVIMSEVLGKPKGLQ